MKLILSEYLQTLKERDELDRLLPELLVSMKLVPLSKTQRGTRQFGVDLAAVGNDPEDGIKKLFLFVLKQGDIGRLEWDSAPQSVRQSFNEIFDTYLNTHVSVHHKQLPVVIILATSGDMKEEVIPNWTGYVSQKQGSAEIKFWGADSLAILVEQFLLDEHIFTTNDRHLLRRALALAGEIDFSPDTLYRLIQSQLSLQNDGSISTAGLAQSQMARRILIVNVAIKLYNHWALIEENSKQALVATERALLWTWHRIKDEPKLRANSKPVKALNAIRSEYEEIGRIFVANLRKHYETMDGIAGSIADNAVLSVILFEHIGILASLGLSSLCRSKNEWSNEIVLALRALIQNNACSGSPRLDEQVIDINLALLLFAFSGQRDFANEWLEQLVVRITFSFQSRHYFPRNSMEELCSDENSIDDDHEGFSYPNWLLPTLALWCTYFGRKDLYQHLESSAKAGYPKVCQQLWYQPDDLQNFLYFRPSAHIRTGTTDAPIVLSNDIAQFYQRIERILQLPGIQVPNDTSPFGIGLNFIAYRHFRTLIPAGYLFQSFHQTPQEFFFLVNATLKSAR